MATPLTLLPISTPRKPSRIRFSSSRDASSGSCSGTMPRPQKRFGLCATIPDIVPLMWRAMARPSSGGNQ